MRFYPESPAGGARGKVRGSLTSCDEYLYWIWSKATQWHFTGVDTSAALTDSRRKTLWSALPWGTAKIRTHKNPPVSRVDIRDTFLPKVSNSQMQSMWAGSCHTKHELCQEDVQAKMSHIEWKAEVGNIQWEPECLQKAKYSTIWNMNFKIGCYLACQCITYWLSGVTHHANVMVKKYFLSTDDWIRIIRPPLFSLSFFTICNEQEVDTYNACLFHPTDRWCTLLYNASCESVICF